MHHELYYMQEIVILFGTALLAAWAFRMLLAPSIIGFIFTGMIIGPSSFGFVAQENVLPMQEVGLILLLFMIGIELSPKPLFRMGRSLVVAAGLQLGITSLVAGSAYLFLGGYGLMPALLLGFSVTLSSTAIVLKQLSDRGETSTVAGMICTGILLLQDIAVILIMLALPLIAVSGEHGGALESALVRFAIGIVVVVLLAVVGRKALSFILDKIVRAGGRELTALFAVLMACGGAWLAGMVGWSPAFGACIAGFLLAEVDARHQLAADIAPFRDVFNALFFVSLGMMVDFDIVLSNFPLIIAVVLLILGMKTIVTMFAVRAGGWPIRLALQSGLILCSVSEFGYVLGTEAAKLGIISMEALSLFSACAIGTMLLGSMLVPVAAALSQRIIGMLRIEADDELSEFESETQHHVILVGYGTNGRNLAQVLASTHIPHCLIEMNPSLVQRAKTDGVHVVVGDATRANILEHAGIKTAHTLVVAINDPVATTRIVSQARAVRRDLFILARTRFVEELETLKRAGASRVIPEDFETSIEISAQVLKELAVPDNIIEVQISAIRAGNYAMLRGKPTDRVAQVELMEAIQSTATRTHYLAEQSPAVGKTIAALNLRALSGVTIIAVVRNGKAQTNPPADYVLQMGDVLVLVGAHVQLESAKKILDPPPSKVSEDT